MFEHVNGARLAAKRVQAQLGTKATLAREITARAAGWSSWHNLERTVGTQSAPASAPHEDLSSYLRTKAPFITVERVMHVVAPDRGQNVVTHEELREFMAARPPSFRLETTENWHWHDIMRDPSGPVASGLPGELICAHERDDCGGMLRIHSFTYQWRDGGAIAGQVHGNIYLPRGPLSSQDAAMAADDTSDSDTWTCLNIGRSAPDAFKRGVVSVLGIELQPKWRGRGNALPLLTTALSDIALRHKGIGTIAIDPVDVGSDEPGATPGIVRAAAKQVETIVRQAIGTMPGTVPDLVLFDNKRSGRPNETMHMVGSLMHGADPDRIEMPDMDAMAERIMAAQDLMRRGPRTEERETREPLDDIGFGNRFMRGVEMGLEFHPPEDIMRHFPREVTRIEVDMRPGRLNMDDDAVSNRLDSIRFGFANGTALSFSERDVMTCGDGGMRPYDAASSNGIENVHMDMPYGDMARLLATNANMLFGIPERGASAMLARNFVADRSFGIHVYRAHGSRVVGVLAKALAPALEASLPALGRLVGEHAVQVMREGRMDRTYIRFEENGRVYAKPQFTHEAWPASFEIHDIEVGENATKTVGAETMTFGDISSEISPSTPLADQGCPAYSYQGDNLRRIVVAHARGVLGALRSQGPAVTDEELGLDERFWFAWRDWINGICHDLQSRRVSEAAALAA